MIVFHNPGLLHFHCLRAFGVSVKPNTTDPIGRFGSGLKMAIAICLRLHQRVTLYRGLDRYVFKTKPVEIRGKSFDFVVMVHPDGTEEELAFNTHVGEHLEAWCAYREFHSNALDEGGQTIQWPDDYPYRPKENETAFVVQGKEIEEAHAARHTIFLDAMPLFATPRLAVYSGHSKYAYYRGVRVLELSHESLYTYNIRDKVDLTEDRTLKEAYNLDQRVVEAISLINDTDYLRAVLAAPEDTYEQRLYHGWYSGPDEAVSDQLVSMYDTLRAEGRVLELTGCATGLYLKRRKHLPIPEPVTLNRIQSKQLAKAIAFCHALGWTVDQYPIITVSQQRNGLLAWAQDGTIVLTERVFASGTKCVVAALYEEWLHIRHGFKDHTREFQNHLFDTILTLGEQVVGEPV